MRKQLEDSIPSSFLYDPQSMGSICKWTSSLILTVFFFGFGVDKYGYKCIKPHCRSSADFFSIEFPAIKIEVNDF
jgi:hypothetical protein